MIDAPFSRRVTGKSRPSSGSTRTRSPISVARAQREIDEGHIPSCQLAFARDGELAVWVTLGDAAPESRYVIFSSTKPVVASAVWILMGEGAIDVSRRVAELVPEFATNGKDVITIEQVMLHTSGFPRAPFVAARLGRSRAPAGALRGVDAATGSRARASSTTRPRRTGCWPS